MLLYAIYRLVSLSWIYFLTFVQQKIYMEKLDIRKLKSVLSMSGNYKTMLVAFIIMLLLFPIEGKFKYNYKKGSTWNYESLESPIDFPILKTDKELQLEKSEAASKVIPYYSLKLDVLTSKLDAVKELYNNGKLSRDLYNDIVDALTEVYSNGILKTTQDNGNVIFVDYYGSATQKLESSIYSVQGATERVGQILKEKNYNINIDSLFTAIEINSLIVPNLIFDKIATDKLQRSAIDFISPTKGIVYTGQYIVGEGELITESTEQILNSLKAEYQKSVGYDGNIYEIIFGHIIIILSLLILVYIAIYFSDYQILRKQNEFNFIIFILCFNFITTMLVNKFAAEYLFIVPFTVTALYMYAFVYNRVVLPIYFISLLPLLLVSDNGVELYLLYSIGGALAFATFSIYDKGWQQFLNALYVFLVMAIVHTGFILSTSGDWDSSSLRIYIYLFLNSIFMVMAYTLVFLLEKLFRMVSMSSYKELSDTDNKMLRELAQKAPGTFQHSLQVSNLAERAVVAIGGNSRLVRVGAMYHDIGKILNPQAFIENQTGTINYHASLTPLESATIILNHVTDGIELAKKYKLPQVVQDFILTHHAHSTVEYFYNVYCNNGGNPDEKDKFTYMGELPSTKEQVVVLMADAVEAASRSLQEYSKESISNLVDSVVEKRLSGNQLERADISIKEINVVKRIFKQMLQDIYHARIVYPKRNN